MEEKGKKKGRNGKREAERKEGKKGEWMEEEGKKEGRNGQQDGTKEEGNMGGNIRRMME